MKSSQAGLRLQSSCLNLPNLNTQHNCNFEATVRHCGKEWNGEQELATVTHTQTLLTGIESPALCAGG